MAQERDQTDTSGGGYVNEVQGGYDSPRDLSNDAQRGTESGIGRNLDDVDTSQAGAVGSDPPGSLSPGLIGETEADES